MLRTIWIDDEEDARFLLRKILSENFTDKLELIGEADGVESGLKLISRTKPDLIFLDIQMRDGTGFDILTSIDINCHIVFITAYDKYAIRAFKFSAFDYLLKPIKKSELIETIDRLHAMEELKSTSLDVLKDNLSGSQESLVVRDQNDMHVILFKDLLRIESQNQYSKLVTKTNAYISSKNLKFYADLLLDSGFFRVHNRHLVNLSSIIKVDMGENTMLILSNNEEIPVSRAKKKSVLEKFVG